MAYANNRPKYSSNKYKYKNFSTTAKKISISIIAISILVVIISLIYSVLSNPERVIKKKIEAISSDYYEHSIYDNAAKNNPSEDAIAKALSAYRETGLAIVSFRQLLLYDKQNHNQTDTIVSKYCDINKSYVQFFPKADYKKGDVEIVYHYNCNF